MDWARSDAGASITAMGRLGLAHVGDRPARAAARMLRGMADAQPLPPPAPAAQPRAPARRVIPIRPAASAAQEDALDCGGAEVFALRVLGTSMAPEFDDGDIVVIEPQGRVHDGAYVLVQLPREGWVLRRLRAAPTAGPGDASWWVEVLDGSTAPVALAGPAAVAGVVIQRARPGRRRETRWYGD